MVEKIDTKIPGSNTRKGWLYHDFNLPDHFPNVHRRNTKARLEHLKPHLDFTGKRVIDLGCSSGGITLGIACMGADHVYGADYDADMLEIAKAMATNHQIFNASFHNQRIPDTPHLKKNHFPHANILVWLSQWMWCAKDYGLQEAKHLLYALPKNIGVVNMIFESAADDGKAPLFKGATQEDIYNFLIDWSPFSNIRKIGPFPDGWQKREVFVCDSPEYKWGGRLGKATVERVKADRIRKTWPKERIWARNNELKCYKRLKGNDFFPQLLDQGEDWLELSWAGSMVRVPHHLDQLEWVTDALLNAGIYHRDINWQNLSVVDGVLKLFDFEFAEVDGKPPPVDTPENLGRGVYPPTSRNIEWTDKKACEALIHYIKKVCSK